MVASNFITFKVENPINIMKADREQLLNTFSNVMNFDLFESGSMAESDNSLETYVLNNAYRDVSGRLILPCLWDKKVNTVCLTTLILRIIY